MCGQLHFNICKEMGVNWESMTMYVPKLVENIRDGKVTLLWHQQCKLRDHTEQETYHTA